MNKPKKVYKLSNGQEVVSIKDAEERLDQKQWSIKKTINRLTSAVTSRASLLSQLGKSFSGDRELYDILGYPTKITFQQYEGRYSRQEIAKACIDRPINSSWRKKPTISDNEDPDKEQTAFEEEVISLEKRVKTFNYMLRADKLASIGTYSVLLLGFSDVGSSKELINPVNISENNQLNYISVFSEANAAIDTWEKDASSERFGQPVTYNIKVYLQDGKSSVNYRVHYTRVIHIVNEALESDIYGTPQLKAIFNRLQDLETISGGSAEMYWKGARPGYALKIDEEFDFDDDAKSDLAAELDEWDHELRRFLRLQGIEVTPLETQVSSPKDFIDPLMDLVSAGVNIPKRILFGSERGELASSQDKGNWDERMESRREDFIEPTIIRPFIDRLIEYKALPEPKDGEYNINWPEFEVPGEEAIVKNAEIAAKALAAYNNSPGVELILPPEEFLQRFFGYSKEEADEILANYEEMLDEEEDIVEEEEDFEDE